MLDWRTSQIGIGRRAEWDRASGHSLERRRRSRDTNALIGFLLDYK